MWIINPITLAELEQYNAQLELWDPIPIGFTGVASQEIPSIFSNEVDDYTMLFGFAVDFSPGDAKIWVRSISPQYEWNAYSKNGQPNFMPLSAVAGIVGQVLPVMPLIMPFTIFPNGKLEMRFINASSSPITGGNISLRRLKLVGKK
jgi:hypothetical protein